MIRGIERQLFEGDCRQGKNPKYSITNYQDNNFKTCGEIFSTSLAQGGPAPNFIQKWCYHFLCHGELPKDGLSWEVTDMEIKNLIQEVEMANEDELVELSGQLVACGYTGPINIEKKEAITAAVTLHAMVRLIPMLNQIREGLRLYGLNNVLAQHPHICEQLFVPGHLKDVDSDFLVSALSPNFSEEGTSRRQQEMRVINFLQDFLQKLEDGEDVQNEGCPLEAVPDKKCLSVKLFLQWVTGQAHVPLTESERELFKIIVNFEHDCESLYGHHTVCYPVVNACAVTITFPIRHLTCVDDFENCVTEAILNGYEFGRH